jgi:N-acetylneuraminic acid mutarotase
VVRAAVCFAFIAGCTLAGDKNHCEIQTDCLDGFTCSAAGVCEHATTCTPAACDGRCGAIADDCGGTLACGACPEHCSNDARDPSETDVDCGGDCMPCATGLHCGTTNDCQTGTCDGGTCRAGRWSTAAPMPTARAELAAVVGLDGRIYAIGGRTPGGTTAVVEAYDPGDNSWTTRAPMPTPRYGLAATVGADGTIYAIGGQYTSVSDAGASIVAEAYDPMANTWHALPDLPIGRDDAAAAVGGDGTVYAIGGFDGLTFQTLGSVATWQSGAPSWSVLPDAMTTARSMHVAHLMPDGQIYVLGGAAGVATPELGATERYQPGASGWHTLAPMPTPRKALAAAALGARLYAIGGSRYNGAGIPYTNVVEVFDTSAPAWAQVASLPTGRYFHAAVAVAGKIYVLGGRREDLDATTGTMDVYTPDP